MPVPWRAVHPDSGVSFSLPGEPVTHMYPHRDKRGHRRVGALLGLDYVTPLKRYLARTGYIFGHCSALPPTAATARCGELMVAEILK